MRELFGQIVTNVDEAVRVVRRLVSKERALVAAVFLQNVSFHDR